ncbi:MFS transporter [Phenylobacterium sp. LjRoot225]|uniref:MFS transporter n=1 Tax=Phenylobacterium sp. LjRoot225 TaxID=3342285 RepID=UPI003ED1306A
MASAAGAGPKGGWYYGWNIVAACILSQVACNGLTYNAYSLFLRSWSEELHTPISLLQLPIAGMGVMCALTSPFIGALADKTPPRRIFAFGLLGMALFMVGISFATATWQLIALYAGLVPFALGCATAIPANALISRWFVKRRGLALGLSAFGIGMAGVVLPPIIAAALPAIGWRAIWQAGALLTVVVVLPTVLLIIRNQPTEKEGLHYLSGDGAAAADHGHGHGGPSTLGTRDVLKRKAFWLLIAAWLPIMAINGGVGQNLAPYAASHGFSTDMAGALISVFSLAHLVATLGLGVLSDRFGNRIPFAGLALVVAAGAATLAFGSSLPLAFIGAALIGLGGGWATLLAAGMAAEFGAEGFGRAFGLAMAFIPISALVPFAIAKTQEVTGSYAPALLGVGVVVLIGGGLILLLKERHHGQLTAAEKEAALDEVVPTPIA